MKKELAKYQLIVQILVYMNHEFYESALKRFLYCVSKVYLLNLKSNLAPYEFKFK